MEINEKEICDGETYNNIKADSKTTSKINNILKSDEIIFEDENEYKKIKEELEKYKKEKEKEVEDLEKELELLKNENSKYENVDDGNNILLNDKIIEKLKQDVINEVKKEIDQNNETIQKEINKKLEEIKKENENYIENKYKDTINNDIKKWKKELEGKYLNEKKQNIDKNHDNNKINVNKHKVEIKKTNQNNKDKNLDKNIPNKKEIKEDDNKKTKNYNSNLFLSNNPDKNNNERNNKLDIQLKSDDHPVKITEDKMYERGESLDKSKKDNTKNLFNIFHNIFFKNKDQTSIKSEKINEYQLDNISKIYLNYRKERKEYILTNYFDNFVKTNLLKFFERKGIEERVIENLKHNIETILEYFELNKYKYKDYYYSSYNRNTQIRDRKKSLEAARRFRKEFNIDETIIKEEELLKKLDKNDNDINKVLQQMYG